jgi:methyl-accepting chemotaxis protein
MSFTRFSIKSLTNTMLIILGVSAIILSIIAGSLFRQAAFDSQASTLSRIIEVAAREEINQLLLTATDLGAATQKPKAFRKAVKKFSDKPENKTTVVTTLDSQFSQRFVTANKLGLFKLRVYDTKFNWLAESSKGISGLPKHLPTELLKQVKNRKGAERLKAAGSLWQNNKRGIYSVLAPVGGLRLIGYIEMVVDPAFNLRDIGAMLGNPLLINSVDDKELFKSDDWNSDHGDNALEVHYTLTSSNGEAILNLVALEDVSYFQTQFNNAQYANIIAFIVLVFLLLAASYWVMNRSLFKPLAQFRKDMSRCAEGDLTIHVTPHGLRDTQELGADLKHLVTSLHTQMNNIGDNSEQLSAAAEELSVITAQTNTGIQQQQSETDQLATAMNEMSATVQEVAQNAEIAAASTENTTSRANEGKRMVSETMDAIEALANDIQSASDVIQELNTHSESIGSVVEVIRGIAEQTNLLALNAAIEAARAGEQGRGFAVVADEVRTLASRTQESTQEIQAMVEKLQVGSKQAVEVMNKSQEQAKTSVDHAAQAGESLDSITTAVSEVSDMNIQIATAAEEQSAVAEEINRNVISISQVTSQTADGSEQTASASESMAQLASQLQAVVNTFKLK